MIMIALSYIIITSVGCSPMGIITYEILNTISVDSQIALANVDNKESYGHVYIIIDNKPYEPRYFGLHLQDNIDYTNPYAIYNSSDEYIDEHTILPEVITITDAVMEMLIK